VEDSGKGNALTASIFKILYATADGFEQTDEEAAVSASAVGKGTVDQVDAPAPEAEPLDAC
jgi:hypothetical protein